MNEQQIPLTADELRSRLVANYNAAKPILDSYYEYAQRAAALATEFHAARFKEAFPTASTEELTLATTCDSRETPVTLERKLSELSNAGITVKKIIFDRVNTTYYLFI